MEEFKKCRRCGERLHISLFSRNKADCKQCSNTAARELRQSWWKNPENLNKTCLKCGKPFIDHGKRKPRKYCSKACACKANPGNPEKKAAWHAAWYANNLERERQKKRDWSKDNSEYLKAKSRAHRKMHPEQSRARMAKRREQLDDVYVAGIIRQPLGLKKSDIPPELIKAKRLLLKFKRKSNKEKQNVG